MVVIGLDDRNVYLEDPFLLGSRLNMTRETFVASWHDYESELPVPPGASTNGKRGMECFLLNRYLGRTSHGYRLSGLSRLFLHQVPNLIF